MNDDDQTPVGGLATSTLGVYHALLATGLLLALVWLWPNGVDKDDKACFLFDVACGREVRLILLVATAGALGSFVHATTSLTSYIGNRTFVRSWVWWYLLRPFVGMGLAEIVYFAIRGGLLTVSGSGSDGLNHFGIVALAGLVGMFSKQATDKLREVFDTMFRTQIANERKDKLRPTVPTLDAVDPKVLAVGATTLELTLKGSAFADASQVTVNGKPRRSRFVDATSMTVTLEPTDLAVAGTLDVVVVNPGPGGGASKKAQVTVTS